MSTSMLDNIFAHKRAELAARRELVSLYELARAARISVLPPHDIVAALGEATHQPALIAEIKRASPSRGLLAPDLNLERLARAYAASGAVAISVLTDEPFFRGSLDDLHFVAGLDLGLPLLRKDFIFDPYQVYEARVAGADSILLIAAYLDELALYELHALALELGITPLVEVHTEAELELALSCRPRLVGINNRDLHTFQVSLETTRRLVARIPEEITVVAESGIFTPQQVSELATLPRPGDRPGVDAILVGEALVTAPNPEAQARQLATAGRPTMAAGAPQ